MNQHAFKNDHPFTKRKAESDRIREKYPDRVPIIIERSIKSEVPDIDKKKFLVPGDQRLGEFLVIIRKRIKLTPEMGLFIFVKNTLPRIDVTMSKLYADHKDLDGFLYLVYSAENTFGNNE